MRAHDVLVERDTGWAGGAAEEDTPAGGVSSFLFRSTMDVVGDGDGGPRRQMGHRVENASVAAISARRLPRWATVPVRTEMEDQHLPRLNISDSGLFPGEVWSAPMIVTYGVPN
ncbi:hypothetical protein Pen01_71920 [Phytomonospora endophytica]|nr:hypothetical protein Pen01_71920 [Phytomonospora endophytica]